MATAEPKKRLGLIGSIGLLLSIAAILGLPYYLSVGHLEAVLVCVLTAISAVAMIVSLLTRKRGRLALLSVVMAAISVLFWANAWWEHWEEIVDAL